MIRYLRVSSALLVLAAAGLCVAPAAYAKSDKSKEAPAKLTPAEKEAARAAALKLSADALEKLYKIHPESRKAVEGAVGYGVFDITSVYAIMFVGQKGKGVLHDNASKKDTFMTSNRMGTGPGVGKQRVFQVFVFKSKGAMEQFVSTGSMGADVTGTISTGTEGSVRSFNPSIDIYQIPESGVAVQASWGGTVYAIDADLN